MWPFHKHTWGPEVPCRTGPNPQDFYVIRVCQNERCRKRLYVSGELPAPMPGFPTARRYADTIFAEKSNSER